MSKDYETDYYGWVMEQAGLARKRSANAFDWDRVAEALDALGASEERELESRYRLLLTHLLKWIVQPERRGRSWENTIANQRDALFDHLARNPGLKPKEAAEFAKAYRRARRDASSEMDLPLDAIPEQPPFSLAQAKDPAWMPD